MLEALVLRVVQVDQLEAIHAKQPQGTLDGAAHLLSGEVPGREVPIRLGCQYYVLWQAAHLREHLTYPALALPVAV